MEAMSCARCRFLSLSEDREEHIIQRHFLFKNWRDIRNKDSFFFCNSISPQQLFHEVRMKPRSQFRQGVWSTRDPFDFYYFLRFDFDVGVYPQHPGRNCTTNMVKIVCRRVLCPACGFHQPTKIKTIYPFCW